MRSGAFSNPSSSTVPPTVRKRKPCPTTPAPLRPCPTSKNPTITTSTKRSTVLTTTTKSYVRTTRITRGVPYSTRRPTFSTRPYMFYWNGGDYLPHKPYNYAEQTPVPHYTRYYDDMVDFYGKSMGSTKVISEQQTTKTPTTVPSPGPNVATVPPFLGNTPEPEIRNPESTG